MTDYVTLARARVADRWQQAFGELRWCWTNAAGVSYPFTVENSKAIDAGCSCIMLPDNITANVNLAAATVAIDGNTFALSKLRCQPEPVLISTDHDCSHFNNAAILSELVVLTGISAKRWLLDVNASGYCEVHIAASDAFIAPEIRERPLNDFASLAQWLSKYSVKATPQQLQKVFGNVTDLAGFEGVVQGSDDTVLKPFMAAITVHVHHKSRKNRRLSMLGTSTMRHLCCAAGCNIFMHGCPVLPFNDIALWRCCYYNNKELHVYDYQVVDKTVTVPTLSGVLKVPSKHAPKAFVPWNTMSGNIFGDKAVLPPMDVAMCAPQQLTAQWIQKLNANCDYLSFAHATLLLRLLEPRWGLAAVLRAFYPLMSDEQYHVLCRMPRTNVVIRKRYVTYVRTVLDLLDATQKAPHITLKVLDKVVSVPPTLRWSQLMAQCKGKLKIKDTAAVESTAQFLQASGRDFLLEELRSKTICLDVAAL